MQKKNFSNPDMVNTFPHATVERVTVGDETVVRNIFEPGWRWSTDMKPTAGTDSCQTHHLLYIVSGRLRTMMEDGTAMDMGPGDVADIPPGHDGWVEGNEPVVAIDIGGIAF